MAFKKSCVFVIPCKIQSLKSQPSDAAGKNLCAVFILNDRDIRDKYKNQSKILEVFTDSEYSSECLCIYPINYN